MSDLPLAAAAAAEPEVERTLVSVERILVIEPHPNADAIEMAEVLGWRVVVSKSDAFKPGDLVLYYRIDSVLSKENPDYAFLKGKPLGTKKIRGELSQGLVRRGNAR
jgi:RNA ligase (TIGR02306 family)